MKGDNFVYIGMRKKIVKYWETQDFGQEILNELSESELLLLIPNNKKRVLGLPLTRITGKKKRYTKNKRKSQIFKSHFDFVDKCIAKAVVEEINRMMDGFVDVKNLMLGEPNIYNWEIL